MLQIKHAKKEKEKEKKKKEKDKHFQSSIFAVQFIVFKIIFCSLKYSLI